MFELMLFTILMFWEDSQYAGPRCFGHFCIDRQMSTGEITKHLSTAKGIASPFCYENPTGNAFLAIRTFHSLPGRVAEVLLSDFPNCPQVSPRRIDASLLEWKTKEGIGLGSLENEVRRAYGKPSAVESVTGRTYSVLVEGQIPAKLRNVSIGEKCLYYLGARRSTELGDAIAEFGIRHGRVSWIFLSVNE